MLQSCSSSPSKVPELWWCILSALSFQNTAAMTEFNAFQGTLEKFGRLCARMPSPYRLKAAGGVHDPAKTHIRKRTRRLGGESIPHHPARGRNLCRCAEPDWDAEMSLFRKRTMKPNQMQTVRRLEEQVDIGKVRRYGVTTTLQSICSTFCDAACSCWQVLFAEDGLAILEGLNNDAPVGAALRFVSGASG